MEPLSELNIDNVKSHMLQDASLLKIKYKARKLDVIIKKVLNSEVEDYEKKGYSQIDGGNKSKTKTTLSLKKKCGDYFEDNIWCMFYDLGFRILNADEKLNIQWGPNEENTQQIDVIAVGEDAIFVVECKATESPKVGNFKKELDCMEQYKDGVATVLKKIYGQEKKVKFIFATRNYRFSDTGEDLARIKHNGFFHLNDNSYNYINNLVKSYKSSVIYQFHALMFKDQLIDDKPIVIPALKGKMGDNNYYLFSVEPKTLLKVGFVLHRTRVNDSMAPTYQRLLVPSRLNGITKFINGGGFFPNSVIINFFSNNNGEDIKLSFQSIPVQTSSNTEFGFLSIPNAYGFAYIIDGQHRVYGYANSEHLDDNTIPVVAFENMPSEQQLKLFMEINENQKAVSPSLRLDLEEDLYWKSKRPDSKMKALRSSVIKQLSSNSNYILYNKITVGEDNAELKFPPFDNGLRRSGLLPQTNASQYIGETDVCLFNVCETNEEKAMTEGRDRLIAFINGVYSILDNMIEDENKSDFLFSNRASFAIVALSGSLNSFIIHSGKLSSSSTVKDRIIAITPYIVCLANAINKMTQDEKVALKSSLGSGADPHWLHTYQNMISNVNSEYLPDELVIWRETQNESIQKQGNLQKDKIFDLIRKIVYAQLESIYGTNWENNFVKLKNECQSRMIKDLEDTENFSIEDYDWKDWLDINDFKKIVDKHFTQGDFAQIFTLPSNENVSKRNEKLAWMGTISKSKGKKAILMTQADVEKLEFISMYLNSFLN